MCILLQACSTRPPQNLVNVNVNHVSQAYAWEMQGKLAVRTEQDKFSTNLYWLHTPTRDRITLTTMLGTTVLSLTRDPSGSTLQLDGNTYQDSDPQRLLARLTGWSIPIDTLPLWITGQVSATDVVTKRDDAQRPISAHTHTATSPWQVQFKSWQQQSGAELPRLLDVNKDSIRLKIQVSQWQALAPKDNQITNGVAIATEGTLSE